MLRVVGASGGQPVGRDEKIARRYCFRATTTIARKHAERPYAVVFGYDAKPLVATDVQQVAQDFCTLNDEAFEADDVELVLFEECPVELSDEIYFQLLEDAGDGDDGDDSTSRAGA